MNEDIAAAFDATLVLLGVPRAAHETARARFASAMESVFGAGGARRMLRMGLDPDVERMAEAVARGAERDWQKGRLERVIR